MKWKYIILKSGDKHSLHEVFYDSESDNIVGYSENPVNLGNYDHPNEIIQDILFLSQNVNSIQTIEKSLLDQMIKK